MASEFQKVFQWIWLKYLALSEVVFEEKEYSKGEANVGRRWAYKQGWFYA